MQAIVIYSKTGNTRSVAKRLLEIKQVPLLEVKVENDNPQITNPKLIEIPDISTYSHIIIGSPVHGFSLSKAMKTYLDNTDFSLKHVDLYITQYFPFAWMGGNQTLKQMKNIILSKGGTVGLMTSVNWKNKNREKDIQKMIENYIS